MTVVSVGTKQVASELGHLIASSSPLLAGRLAALPEALAQCRAAILARDIEALGEVAEADALSLHAIAMTSRPSALYWEPGTVALLRAVRAWRAEGIPAYFTIDAGPNVHILTEPRWLHPVLDHLRSMPEVTDVIVCGAGRGAAVCEPSGCN